MSKSPGKQIILKLTRDELLEKCQRDTNWVGEKNSGGFGIEKWLL